MFKFFCTFMGCQSFVCLKLFHYFLMVCAVGVWIICMVSVSIGVIFSSEEFGRFYFRDYHHNNSIELMGIVLPVFSLIFMAYASYRCLIIMEPFKYPNLTVKVLGVQWYWEYEIQDWGYDWSVESRLKKNTFGEVGFQDSVDWWLYGVDYPLVLPINQKIQVVVTSSDVIHSWALPSLGIKMDCIPGMSNCTPVVILNPGVYVGMCSELCGANHSQMPIFVEAVSMAVWRDKMASDVM